MLTASESASAFKRDGMSVLFVWDLIFIKLRWVNFLVNLASLWIRVLARGCLSIICKIAASWSASFRAITASRAGLLSTYSTKRSILLSRAVFKAMSMPSSSARYMFAVGANSARFKGDCPPNDTAKAALLTP